jgi:hypothetical protein
MSLDKDKLYKSLKKLEKNMPQSLDEAAQKWADAIKNYYLDALAGDTIPTFSVELKNSFKSSMKSRKFLELLGTNLQSFMQPAVWNSVAFTGVTASAVGSGLDSMLFPVLAVNLSGKNSDPLAKIVEVIHNWSLTITVTLTNNQSGVTSIINIM